MYFGRANPLHPNFLFVFFLDVALYTDPEEIYLVRKDGTVMMYDPTNLKETPKIKNSKTVG